MSTRSAVAGMTAIVLVGGTACGSGAPATTTPTTASPSDVAASHKPSPASEQAGSTPAISEPVAVTGPFAGRTFYLSAHSGEGHIEVVAVRDAAVVGSLLDLDHPPGYVADIAVSPDGSAVAYRRVEYEDSERNQGPTTLTIRHADGTSVDVLSTTAYETSTGGTRWGSVDHLRWSPDGSLLAFAWTKESLWTEVYLVGADGTGLRHVTPPDGGDWPSQDEEPFWGATSDVFYWQAARDQRGTIWRARTDGSEPTRITPVTEPEQFNNAVLSPDGRYLATQSGNEDSGGLWLLDLQTGTFAEHYRPALSQHTSPAWSPDGAKVVYALAYRIGDTEQPGTLLILTAATGQVDLLATPCGPRTVVWADDSRHVLSACGGDPFVVDTASGEVAPAPDLFPDLGAEFVNLVGS